jgi:orotidine-5'-phosphate decarboxylase
MSGLAPSIKNRASAMTPTIRNPRDRLIVALDFPEVDAAKHCVRQIGDQVSFYKIGLELVLSGGLDLVRQLKGEGKRVFLDMKLLDIANTVEKATAAAARLGVDLLTIHGHDRKTLQAAAAGRGTAPMQIVSVTVMTHLTADDLRQQGSGLTPAELVSQRAAMAAEAGIDGVVASAQEARMLRQQLGTGFLIVTPGIRPAGADAGDQSRVSTPAMALTAGADYLVIGRPITAAADPAKALNALISEMAAVLPHAEKGSGLLIEEGPRG